MGLRLGLLKRSRENNFARTTAVDDGKRAILPCDEI